MIVRWWMWLAWALVGLALEMIAVFNDEPNDTLTQTTLHYIPGGMILLALAWVVVHFAGRVYRNWRDHTKHPGLVPLPRPLTTAEFREALTTAEVRTELGLPDACEMCSQMHRMTEAVGYFGTDDTPLCKEHLDQAYSNYEAAVRANVKIVREQPKLDHSHDAVIVPPEDEDGEVR